MTAVTHDLGAKLWNLCNVLKDDGVTYHQYVTELTYPLLQDGPGDRHEDQLPEGYRWGALEAQAAPDRLELYRSCSSARHPRLAASEGDPCQRRLVHPQAGHPLTLVAEIDEVDRYSARQDGSGTAIRG